MLMFAKFLINIFLLERTCYLLKKYKVEKVNAKFQKVLFIIIFEFWFKMVKIKLSLKPGPLSFILKL